MERDARLQNEREALHAKEAVHRLFARHQLDLAAAGAAGRGVVGAGGGSSLASRDASPLRIVRPPREVRGRKGQSGCDGPQQLHTRPFDHPTLDLPLRCKRSRVPVSALHPHRHTLPSRTRERS